MRIDWSGVASTAVLYVKAWAGVILSVVLASLIIYKAVVDRQRRQERAATLPYQEVGETAEDWMSRYQDDQPVQPAPVETLTVSVSTRRTRRCFATNTARRPQHNPLWTGVGFRSQQRAGQRSRISVLRSCPGATTNHRRPRRRRRLRSTTWNFEMSACWWVLTKLGWPGVGAAGHRHLCCAGKRRTRSLRGEV